MCVRERERVGGGAGDEWRNDREKYVIPPREIRSTGYSGEIPAP